MKCPKCGSDRVERYVTSFDCLDCGYIGGPEKFGAKCNCAEEHPLPVWRCPTHGDVAVDAG